MKKILLPILALGGLLFASSCQMDEPDSGTLTGEVDFSITAGIPSGITTYAEGAEAFSHQGGASNLSTGDYILRYTLQVYDEDDKLSYEGVQYAPDFGGVTFEARLLAKVYDFVFWADFVSASDQVSDLYYNTEDLRKISYTSSVTDDNIPSDALDAYYKTEVVNLSQSGQKINNVTLKRPFGKIRFVATDELSEQQKGAAVDNGNVSVAYKEGTVLPNVFNAQTGKADISQEYPRMSDFTATPVAEKASVNGNVHENAYLLGYDYIFCSESQPSYAMDVTVSIDGVSPVTRSLSSIPVQENKLTTIIGNFYTNEGSIDVVVDDMFDNEEEVDVEDLIYPDEGVLNNTTNEKYNSIAEAIADAKNEDVLTLAAQQFDEIININQVETRAAVTSPEVLTIVGQEGSMVNGIYILAGDITLKNIEFNGAGESAAQGSTVYVGGKTANLELQNCIIGPATTLPSQGRPILTETGFGGTFIIDGCTVSANGNATYSYLNPAAEGSKIQILNTTFNDPLVAEYYSTGVYPELSGNTFVKTLEFTASEIETNAVDLSYATKVWVNDILANNNFENENKIAAYLGSDVQYYNDPIEIGTVINRTTGIAYFTIAEAVENAENFDFIDLAANTTYDEVVSRSDKDDIREIYIIGQESTKVKAAYLNTGHTFFESIEFYGAGPSAGGYSTIFAGNTASLRMCNCIINVTEDTGGRPVETAYNADVKIDLDDCTIIANNAKNAYLNPVGLNGSIRVILCDFVDKGLTAEFNCDANSARVYPEIIQNNFGSNTLGFSYYAEPKITDASGLDDKTKEFCINVLEQNTFTGENKIKVTPLEYVQGNFFWINDPADLISEANNDMGVSLALEKALRKALTEQGCGISASQKLSYTDLHNLTGELDLSNSGISQLGINDNGFYNNPLSGNGGGQSKFADGLKNVTKIDLSGNTFTYVPACTFYGPDGDGNFTDPAPDHKLQEIVLPESCTALYQWAIHKLPSLRTVNVGNITSMGDYAMACNRNLELNINTDLNKSLALAKKTFRFSPKVTGSLDEYAEETNIWFGVEWGSSDRKDVTSDLYSFEETGVTGTVEGLVNSKWLYISAFTNACAVSGDVLDIPAEIEGKPLVDFADWLFQKWLIKEAYIPSSVEYFGYGIFNNCPNLKKVSLYYVDSYNPGKVYTDRANSYLLGGSTDNITEITIYYNEAEPADKDDFLSKVFGSDLDAVKDKISWVMQ